MNRDSRLRSFVLFLLLMPACILSCFGQQQVSPSIFDNGNVGIGTTRPAQLLEVNGASQFDGQVIFSQQGTHSSLHQDGDNRRLVLVSDNMLLIAPNVITNPISLHFTRFDGTNWRESVIGYTDTSSQLQLQSSGGQVQLTNGTGLYSSGNIGIGTTGPREKLEVNGNVLISGTGGHITFPDGSIQSAAWTGSLCGGDYAEAVNPSGDRNRFEPGDVLVINQGNDGEVSLSSAPYSRLVAGIYSTKPGVVGRRDADPKNSSTQIPMAMVGIVPTKVSTENGAIRKGDLLVASSTAGYAMKGTDPQRMMGAVVGKALGRLDSGTGIIEVLVSLQ